MSIFQVFMLNVKISHSLLSLLILVTFIEILNAIIALLIDFSLQLFNKFILPSQIFIICQHFNIESLQFFIPDYYLSILLSQNRDLFFPQVSQFLLLFDISSLILNHESVLLQNFCEFHKLGHFQLIKTLFSRINMSSNSILKRGVV